MQLVVCYRIYLNLHLLISRLKSKQIGKGKCREEKNEQRECVNGLLIQLNWSVYPIHPAVGLLEKSIS